MRQISKYKTYAIIAVTALLLAGCEEHNPLLGEWSLIKTAELKSAAFKLAQISGNANITFEEGRVISGTQAISVSYSVNGNEVTVNYTNGEKNIYVVENDNHFVFEIPDDGIFKYVRVKKPEVL